jgi:hypothetical protein
MYNGVRWSIVEKKKKGNFIILLFTRSLIDNVR